MHSLAPHRCFSGGPRKMYTCLASEVSTQPRLNPPQLVAGDPGLRSTWRHRAWVAAGSAAVFAAAARSAAESGGSAAESGGSAAEPLIGAALGYAFADLGSGVYHWAVDNYGRPQTPLVGPQIAAFQGHHRRPSTITTRELANNVHALARAVALTVGPAETIASVSGDGGSAAAHAFVAVCAGFVMLSQQFHAWAHTSRGRLPAAVAALQDAGVLISRRQHAEHHRAPYSGNYCIVSGAWNGVLDEWKVFEAVEMVIFFRFGVRPRSWSEPGSNWAEEIVVVQSTNPSI